MLGDSSEENSTRYIVLLYLTFAVYCTHVNGPNIAEYHMLTLSFEPTYKFTIH